MSDKYKIKDNESAYFVTLTTVGWVDVYEAESKACANQLAKILPAA